MILTDIHCHIIPGVDDGSGSLDESIKMIMEARRDGIERIIATPHYHEGRALASRAEREEAYNLLLREIKALDVNMEIYLGNEVFVHDGMVEGLKSGEIAVMNSVTRGRFSCHTEEDKGTNDESTSVTGEPSPCHTAAHGGPVKYVLLEFHPSHDYNRIRQGAYDLLEGGFRPIIAHIERYEAIVRNPDYARELKDLGCLIQVNAGSVTDGGFKTKGFIRTLLKDELISFIATDAHRAEGHRAPRLKECAKFIEKKYGAETAIEIFEANPTKVINGEII